VSDALAVISREEILRRIRGEYLEMPGLRLTDVQAQRLWALDARTCASVLDTLVEDQFLCVGDDCAYGLFSNDTTAFQPPYMVKAGHAPARSVQFVRSQR
jgi:hypothetical protein